MALDVPTDLLLWLNGASITRTLRLGLHNTDIAIDIHNTAYIQKPGSLRSFWWENFKFSRNSDPVTLRLKRLDNDLDFNVYQVLAAGRDYCILYIFG